MCIYIYTYMLLVLSSLCKSLQFSYFYFSVLLLLVLIYIRYMDNTCINLQIHISYIEIIVNIPSPSYEAHPDSMAQDLVYIHYLHHGYMVSVGCSEGRKKLSFIITASHNIDARHHLQYL